jgi:hypothetical protein
MTDKTPAKHLEPYKWEKGVSANPLGRPKGSRNKLAEDFLSDVLEEWQAHGKVAVSDMREKNPGDFVKMVAGLLPKDVNINLTDNLGELSDDELLSEIRKLHASLAPLLAEGNGTPAIAQQPAQLH